MQEHSLVFSSLLICRFAVCMYIPLLLKKNRTKMSFLLSDFFIFSRQRKKLTQSSPMRLRERISGEYTHTPWLSSNVMPLNWCRSKTTLPILFTLLGITIPLIQAITQCPPCDSVDCGDTIVNCTLTHLFDSCHCCEVCLRAAEEPCGGPMNHGGICDNGLWCLKELPQEGVFAKNDAIGVCKSN